MASFQSSIFQHLSGSFGNVTTYELDGKQVARAKTFILKDQKSLAQLKHRTKVRVISRLRRNFICVLSIGFCTISGKVAANCFVKENIHRVEVDDELNVTMDLSGFQLSGGELRLPLIEAEIDTGERRVVFRWEKQPLMPYMYKDDRLYGAVYESQLGRSREIMLGERGVEGELAWNLPEEWKVSGLIVYGFAVRADGKKASGTLGLART